MTGTTTYILMAPKEMRINANESPHLARQVQCLLNGEVLDGCFEADDVLGYALCYLRDDQGEGYIVSNGELTIVHHEGEVRFSLIPYSSEERER